MITLTSEIKKIKQTREYSKKKQTHRHGELMVITEERKGGADRGRGLRGTRYCI